jgi:hypothetical protein
LSSVGDVEPVVLKFGKVPLLGLEKFGPAGGACDVCSLAVFVPTPEVNDNEMGERSSRRPSPVALLCRENGLRDGGNIRNVYISASYILNQISSTNNRMESILSVIKKSEKGSNRKVKLIIINY